MSNKKSENLKIFLNPVDFAENYDMMVLSRQLEAPGGREIQEGG